MVFYEEHWIFFFVCFVKCYGLTGLLSHLKRESCSNRLFVSVCF